MPVARAYGAIDDGWRRHDDQRALVKMALGGMLLAAMVLAVGERRRGKEQQYTTGKRRR